MSDKPRFTLMLTLEDARRFEKPIRWAVGVDNALRISARAVDELKMSVDLGMPFTSQEVAIEMIHTKEIRRKIFKQAAVQLAMQMADRMEDAEGWHDPSRIEPARKALGGDWE